MDCFFPACVTPPPPVMQPSGESHSPMIPAMCLAVEETVLPSCLRPYPNSPVCHRDSISMTLVACPAGSQAPTVQWAVKMSSNQSFRVDSHVHVYMYIHIRWSRTAMCILHCDISISREPGRTLGDRQSTVE